MALRLIEKFPMINNLKLMRRYSGYLYGVDFPVDPLLWLIFSMIAAIIVGLVSAFAAGQVFGLPEQSIQLGALFFAVALDLLIGYPYLLAEQRIERIEEDLPDALRQMSDTLKSGGTYEYALKEIANTDIGPLKKEIGAVLRKLDDGENFESALRTLSENVESRIVKRTVNIIIDSVSSGAGLAGVLDQISEDVREAHRISKERKSRTSLQVIFMFAAGGVIAPMIFGFVSTIAKILVSASASAVSAERIEETRASLGIIQFGIQAYIFIETIASGFMIAIMRDGKMSKSIIYIPILLCIAYVSYLLAGIVSGALVGV